MTASTSNLSSPKFTVSIVTASYPQTDEYGSIIPGPRVSVPVVRVHTEDFVSDYGVESLLFGRFKACDVADLAEQTGITPADLLDDLERIAIKYDASR